MSDSTPTPPPEDRPPPSSPPPTSEQPAAPAGGQYGTAQPGYGQQGGYGEPGAYPAAPGQGYGAPTGGVGQPADLLMRFLARLIDFILVGIVGAIVNGILLVGLLGLGSSGSGFAFSTGGDFAYRAVSSILLTIIYFGYFVLMESRNGQTVGKMLLKLQTQNADGSTPTMEQAAKRNIFTAYPILNILPVLGLIGSLAAFVGIIVIAVQIGSASGVPWHDKFAGGTKVIKIG